MCSIEEAYSMFWQKTEDGDARPPSSSEGSRRKKKRRLPPEPAVIDPDRPAVRPMPTAELLGSGSGSGMDSNWMTEPATANLYDVKEHFAHPSSDVDDDTMYKLEPDWAKPFNQASVPDWIKERMPKRDAETPLTPSPWLDGQPSLWQSIPDGLRTQFNLGGARTAGEERTDALERRLNSMFARLDDMESGRLANNHMEILMFFLGGLVLILILDLIVKQGTQASVLLAAAGGRSLFSGGARGLLWAN
jgi:hypothetical protein